MSDQELDKYLSKLERKNQLVVNYLRELIKEMHPNFNELLKSDGAIFYELQGVVVCFINISREKVVRLGLPAGATLTPTPLLKEAPGELRFVHVIGTINPEPDKIKAIISEAIKQIE